ncbi:GMC family oxidoreductase [Phytomonospora sp. NPDC050363]|uniref:GMC family oxidoreductase n=1 Tax=Phytomonospora sp. NPDC050363 TaxID=3155642 RepID=UPI0033CE8EEC
MDHTPADRASDASGAYDYIVIGSGPGGGPVAANLAEAGFSVLVLEAGPPSGDATFRDVPLFFPKATDDPEVAWEFWVQHYDGGKATHGDSWIDDKGGVLYPRSATIGGCAVHNASIVMYPAHGDWDEIMELTGDEGWHHEAMWRHWQKVLAWQALSSNDPFADLESGRAHPDRLVDSLDGPAWYLESKQGVKNSGKLNDRENVGTAGFWNLENGIKDGVRQGVRDRLLSAASSCPRLEIRCDALVEKILFEPGDSGPRAVGVRFLNGRHLYDASPKHRRTTEAERADMRRTVRARREIIVAGGAYNSPQILMLSGIGPAEHLRSHGIEVLVDSPRVGGNLQDRREISVVDEYHLPELADNRHVTDLAESLASKDSPGPSACLDAWRADPASSPLGMYGNPCVNYTTEGSDRPTTNVCTTGAPFQFRNHHPDWVDEARATIGRTWTWLSLMGYTEDRDGYVRLRSADPTRSPEINFRAFGNGTGGDADLDALVAAIEVCRSINRAEGGGGAEIFPGSEVEDLRDFIRKEHYGHHPACSNPIGRTRADSAVDSTFKVHGTEGLRVVDASVFPKMPGLFLIAAVETLSQKASVDILRDARARG